MSGLFPDKIKFLISLNVFDFHGISHVKSWYKINPKLKISISQSFTISGADQCTTCE